MSRSIFAKTLFMIAGIGIGAASMHAYAQGKPPVYFVAEVDVQNIEGYTKEYAPKATASIKAHGGKIIVATPKPTSFEGEPPKSRVIIQVWESMEQLQGWYRSPEYTEAHDIGAKYAKYRTFAVEGVPPQ